MGKVDKYYVIGFTEDEVADGELLRLTNYFVEITSKNLIDVSKKAYLGIQLKKIELKAFALSRYLSIDKEYYDKKYGEYFDVVFINNNLKTVLERNGIFYNYIETIDENNLPKDLAILLKHSYYLI